MDFLASMTTMSGDYDQYHIFVSRLMEQYPELFAFIVSGQLTTMSKIDELKCLKEEIAHLKRDAKNLRTLIESMAEQKLASIN